MNTKKVLISFLAIATLLFLVATVSAAEMTDDVTVQINGVDVGYDVITGNQVTFPSVLAGETISVKVSFTANVDVYTSNVRIKATLDSDEESINAVTSSFDVEDGQRYVKTLTLVVPYDFGNNEVSTDMVLDLRIWNGDYETKIENIMLRVQKPSHNADVMSIIVSNSIEAGQIAPVDVVLKNSGYNNLEDLYVTVRISELDISKTAYFGDLVAVEVVGEDDEDTVSGRIYLEVPYDVSAGVYTLEVEVVGNNNFERTVERTIAVQNGFPEVGIKSGDNLLVLNPSNQLRVYRIVYPAEEVMVVVQAGSSKTVPIETEASGEYNFDVFVYSGDELVGTVNFSGVDEAELTSPVVLLTVILGIIFLVLLVVLIVLITKKPQKTEEFGESYY